jgi:hypothetical protein
VRRGNNGLLLTGRTGVYREETGVGLKEAKAAVEAFMDSL